MHPSKMSIELRLPNGRQTAFTLSGGKKWQEHLRTRVLEYFPRCRDIRFVDGLPNQQPKKDRPFQTAVMFEIRKNYFVHGYLVINSGGK